MRKGVKTAQQSRYDCGAAALCSLAAWHGRIISLAKARMLCGCTQEGITIKGIIAAGEKLGFNCRGFKSTEKDSWSLEGIPLPAIAHTITDDGFYHFITIIEITDSKFVVMDPAKGEIKKISRNAFSRIWTGYVILAVPSADFKAKNEKGSTWRKLLKISFQYKNELVHIASGTIMLSLTGMCNSIFLQRIIDTAIPQRDIGSLALISAATVALALLGLFISYKKQIYLSVHGIKITSHLVKGYIRKITYLGQQFYMQYNPGDISSRVSDAFNIRTLLTEGVVSIIESFAILGATIPILFHYNATLALMCAASVPVYIAACAIAAPKNTMYSKELAEAGARFESTLLQCIGANSTTRHHCVQRWVLEGLEAKYENLVQRLFKATEASAVLGISTECLSKMIITSVLVSGGFAVFNNSITVGELVSFYTLCPLFCMPLANLANMNPVITRAKVSAERLFEIMDLEDGEESGNSTSDDNTSMHSPACNDLKDSEDVKDIHIRGLSFSYPGSRTLLKEMNITIHRGKITLIEGAVGAGKSTLASLLMRDMAFDEGSVFYGETDITTIDIKEWRKIIGIVPQKCHMFNDSILNNIVLGEKSPNIERVTEICTRLGIIGKIISLPSSLLTRIGEGGASLSGGEMQKIAIARVLYHNPGIIIFDEATSSMDCISEQLVMDIIRHISDTGTTTVVISHNRRFRKLADFIIEIP